MDAIVQPHLDASRRQRRPNRLAAPSAGDRDEADADSPWVIGSAAWVIPLGLYGAMMIVVMASGRRRPVHGQRSPRRPAP